MGCHTLLFTGTLICADIAATSLEQCKERFKEFRDRSGRDFCHADFVEVDATKVSITCSCPGSNFFYNVVLYIDHLKSRHIIP